MRGVHRTRVTSLGDADLLVKSASEERLMSISVRVHLPKKENGVCRKFEKSDQVMLKSAVWGAPVSVSDAGTTI